MLSTYVRVPVSGTETQYVHVPVHVLVHVRDRCWAGGALVLARWRGKNLREKTEEMGTLRDWNLNFQNVGMGS